MTNSPLFLWRTLSLAFLPVAVNVHAAQVLGGGASGGVVMPPAPTQSYTIALHQTRLINNNEGLVNVLGSTVALSGNRAIIGAPLGNTAYLFQRTTTGLVSTY